MFDEFKQVPAQGISAAVNSSKLLGGNYKLMLENGIEVEHSSNNSLFYFAIDEKLVAIYELNDKIIFLRKLVKGGTNRSYGIQVARLAGIPDEVIRRAKKILSNIEKGEHNLNGSSFLVQSEEVLKNGHVQLNLFQRPEYFVIANLQKIDRTKMAPIDALNILNELQEKAKDVSI